ncbi:MAG: ATP-binding protein [Bacteroidota bacterium]
MIPENQKLLIPSKSENIVLIEKLVDDICDLYNIKEEAYGNILVTITEATNNAIRHGNKLDSKKNIEISFEVKDGKLFFTVIDQGPGFDHLHIPDPTDPKNIEKPTGRGIYLMRHLANKIVFENNGSKVIIEFEL